MSLTREFEQFYLFMIGIAQSRPKIRPSILCALLWSAPFLYLCMGSVFGAKPHVRSKKKNDETKKSEYYYCFGVGRACRV